MERDKLRQVGGIGRNEAGRFQRIDKEKLLESGISFYKFRHLFLGDAQYPDVDWRALNTALMVNEDFKATTLWLMGDMLNATTLSKFGYPAEYHFSYSDEIKGARKMIEHIVYEARSANPEVTINYLEGNHELRAQKYIDKNATELKELENEEGERVLAIPTLLRLNEQSINWIPYWEDGNIDNKVTVLHGNITRAKSGYTAHAYIDRHGKSTIAGHDHRLALIFKTQGGETKFGLQNGSLCNLKMEVPYGRPNQLDWQKGFTLLGIDEAGDMFPQAIPIVNGKAAFGGTIYEASGNQNGS